MREERFFGNFDLQKGGLLRITETKLLSQWFKVLRLRPGASITLLDGKGKEARAKIISLSGKKAECIVDEVREVKKEAPKEVTLYLAILKRENFEFATQKATECGVGRIVPLLTEHTVKTGLKIDRLMKIAQEAAEQSGRGKVPLISEPKSFADAVQDSVRQKNYFFDIGARESFAPKNKEACGIWIGPEGGWGGKERMLAGDRKFIFTSLGPRVLRAETAATVASFLACNL